MREILDHLVGPAEPTDVAVLVLDERGPGSANHAYRIWCGTGPSEQAHYFNFQEGLIDEVGVNGITDEALIAIVIDRLRGFQAGEQRCKENACALTHFEEGLHWLQQRTIARMRRGVEGTSAA